MRVERVVAGARYGAKRAWASSSCRNPGKARQWEAGCKPARIPGIVEPLTNSPLKCEVGPQTEGINFRIFPPPCLIAQHLPRALTPAFREGWLVPARRAERAGHEESQGWTECPRPKESSWMGDRETQLPRKWGRRRESYWKLKATIGPDWGKVWMRPALAARPGSASCRVSGWLRAGRAEAAVEKCRKRQSTRAESGKRLYTPGGT